MDDWKAIIDQAMQIETTDTIGAHGLYEHAVRAALAQSQMLLGDLEAAQIIESIYGALVAYSQTVMLRMKAEDPEVGGPDHAFRAGQAYGVSCISTTHRPLTDVAGITALGALDDFSDTYTRKSSSKHALLGCRWNSLMPRVKFFLNRSWSDGFLSRDN